MTLDLLKSHSSPENNTHREMQCIRIEGFFQGCPSEKLMEGAAEELLKVLVKQRVTCCYYDLKYIVDSAAAYFEVRAKRQ